MFGRKAKLRKAVDRALATVEREDDLADYAPIEALAKDLQAHAYYTLALALRDDERPTAALHSLDRAIAMMPDEADLHRLAAALHVELGDLAAAVAAQQRVVARYPRDAHSVSELADLMIRAERSDEVIALLSKHRDEHDPVIDTKLAEALFLANQHDEALAILDEVCALYDKAMKQISGADWHALKSRADEAERLRHDVYAELHGREATIELAAAEGKLDASAGINYRLLGARLAAKSERIADVLELETPEATEARGRALTERMPARGWSLVGAAQLRRGELGPARKSFERACEADGRCFAAFLGLGAVLDHDKYSFHRRATKLVAPGPVPEVVARVVCDWPVLTPEERQVVWASARPLAITLPTLAERGVQMRILPVDVRATDVELFRDVAGVREDDDQRSYDAITGVATHGGAVAKIEELLDVVTEGGWTFAHELAHLAFFHLPEQRAQPLLDIYERALEVGYANIDYALQNPDEFFAVSYADYLRVQHDAADAPIADDAGIQRDLTAYFDGLAKA